MYRFLLIAILSVLINPLLWAQKKGKIEVNADPSIERIMNYYGQLTAQNPGLDGFRIQIFLASGNNSKQAAIDAKSRFSTKYPDIEAYLIFEEPNYKVRVGNFRSKLDAEGCLNKINSTYPNAFVVPDYIDFPKLSDESSGY